jgi:hypothetical protein
LTAVNTVVATTLLERGHMLSSISKFSSAVLVSVRQARIAVLMEK